MKHEEAMTRLQFEEAKPGIQAAERRLLAVLHDVPVENGLLAIARLLRGALEKYPPDYRAKFLSVFANVVNPPDTSR